MQVDVGKERRDHRPLSSPQVTDRDDPVFQDTRLQPLSDETDDALVADAVLHETDQPILADRIEKGADISVKNEVHLSGRDPDRQGIQRIVRAALEAEPVAEAEEVFLVN